jgi:RNA polymerase sigma-70 factor, ECF subfamily
MTKISAMTRPGGPPPEDDPSEPQHHAKLRRRLEQALGSLCPRWLADRKEDLVQAAVMRIMDLERRSEGKMILSASYLRRVAHSTLVDEIRRLQRRREVPLEIDEGPRFDLPTRAPTPERRAEAGQIAAGIRECLCRLVESRRRAVTLYLMGHSVPEAAELLSWSVKRTENLVYRGLADLRQCLSSKGLDP